MSLQDRIAKINQSSDEWRQRTPNQARRLNDEVPTSVASIRQTLLASQNKWQSRVETKDADDFTVAGRLNRLEKQNRMLRRCVTFTFASRSPVLNRTGAAGPENQYRHRTTTRFTTTRFTTADIDTATRLPMQPILRNRNVQSQESPNQESPNQAVSKTESELSTSRPLMSSLSASSVSEPEEQEAPKKQAVIAPTFEDSALAKFFTSEPLTETTYLDNVQLISSDMATPLDEKLSSTYERLLDARRAARPTRRKPSDYNSLLKSSPEPEGLSAAPAESRCPSAPVGQRAFTPQSQLLRSLDPSDRLVKNAQLRQAMLAQAAIAGLSSRENFAKAKSGLRQVAESDAPPLTNAQRQLLPYSALMLLHVKGRRNLQVRLVAPMVESVNSGDCFLLVSPKVVFAWFGQLANVVEVNKCRELAGWICKQHELGYTGLSPTFQEVFESAAAVDDVKEQRNPVKGERAAARGNNIELQFWQALGYESVQPARDPGSPDEDDEYVVNIQHTNRVYEVTTTELTPCETYWGRPLPYSLLKSNKAFVFDFGTEVYLWTGKHISPELRSAGIDLVLQAYAESYDYSSCSVNPFDPLKTHSDMPPCGCKRPDWTLVGRQTESGESILFKEKFLDWPDAARISMALASAKKNAGKKTERSSNPLAMTPYPADQLYNAAFSDPPPPPVLLTLEGRFVGRGGSGARCVDGILRRYRVESGPLRIWHVSEFTRTEMPASSHGQFHQADTYVIRWSFRVAHIGLREVGNRALEQTQEQCAYFFWQGSRSKVSEKGAAALMTMELDDEHGPQIRVAEGKEPPAFCRLFEGRMIIHANRRLNANNSPDESTSLSRLRLFMVRGELPLEGHLVEVAAQLSSLRPQGVFLVVQYQEDSSPGPNAAIGRQIQKAWLWVGRAVSQNGLRVGRLVAQRLKEDCPLDLGDSLHSMVEVSQSENDLGPGEMIFLLNAGDQEPPSFYTSIDTSHAPLVIWHVTVENDLKLSVTRLTYPLQLDASVCSLDASENATSTRGEGESQARLARGTIRINEGGEDPLSMAQAMTSRLRASAAELQAPAIEAMRNQLGFPFSLADLYADDQPGLFIVLAGRHAVYLWQGWWPPSAVAKPMSLSRDPSRNSLILGDVEMADRSGTSSMQSSQLRFPQTPTELPLGFDEERVREALGSSAATGPVTKASVTRFYAVRRAAMQTAKALADKVKCKAFLVYAGIEPLEFLTLFPPSDRNAQASEYYLVEEEKCNGQMDCIDDVLQESLRGATNTLEELQREPRPPDLDTTCLEAYLSPEEFQKAFQMTKNEFDLLPGWRKHELKKGLELF